MRWGVYAYSGFEGAQAWNEGLRTLGHEGVDRSLWDYGNGCREAFDAVVCFGLQGRGRRILEEYRAAGIPVVVIDYGYLRRTNHAHDWRTGHWQVGIDGLNVLPPFDCPSDRFEALGLPLIERGGDPDGYALICTQTTGDATHGLDEEGIQAWVNEQMQRWDRPLLRPHPLQSELTYGAPLCQAPSLQSALAGARVVVAMNSNVGSEALMAGVPAVATMPGAAWASLSGENLPDLLTRHRHFSRAAWGQWTWAEFREGLPQRFLTETWLPLYWSARLRPASTPAAST